MGSMDATKKPHILITGCARTGTSLLTLLMDGFAGLQVHLDTERSPVDFIDQFYNRRQVIKLPQGRKTPTADFGSPVDYDDSSVCYLQNYLYDWLILLCVRDARDILVSKHERYPDRYFVSPLRCRLSLERGMAIMNHPHVLVVRYEELVTTPQTVMDQVALFIGESYNTSHLEQFYTKFNAESELTRALNGLRPIDRASIGNWKKPEHRQRIAEVNPYFQQYIAPLMKRLGYEIDMMTG